MEISGDSLRGNRSDRAQKLVTRSKEIHLEGVTGDLEVETANGDMEVHAANKLPMGKMMHYRQAWRHHVDVARQCGLPVDATTRKGDITSDFSPLKINKRTASRSHGTVGNGAAKLQIKADTGDIRISKG